MNGHMYIRSVLKIFKALEVPNIVKFDRKTSKEFREGSKKRNI